MTYQQFSSTNFRKIWDVRIRRGEDLNPFFPTVQQIHNDMRMLSLEHRKSLKQMPNASPERASEKLRYHEDITKNKKLRDQYLATELENISEKLNQKIDANNLRWGLFRGPTVQAKQTYSIKLNQPIVYFMARQLENNLRSTFDVRTPNRNVASEQLLMSLRDETHKFVVRSDLKSFYESVNHAKLLEILRAEPRLSRTSIRFIEELLKEYVLITGTANGLPRGLGISAILAEIFLGPIDIELSRLDGAIAYLRYVDDFVLIFSTGRHLPDSDERKKSIRRIVSESGLRLNGSKTKYFEFSKSDTPKVLSFLGYQYTISGEKVDVDITSKRLSRYRRKTQMAFDAYAKSTRDTRAEIALTERVEFLTSNTRLANNKRQALIGIYYSNSLLENPTQRIRQLDKDLASKLKVSALTEAAKTKLKTLTFSEGFEQKRFRKYSPIRLRNIVRVWIDV